MAVTANQSDSLLGVDLKGCLGQQFLTAKALGYGFYIEHGPLTMFRVIIRPFTKCQKSRRAINLVLYHCNDK